VTNKQNSLISQLPRSRPEISDLRVAIIVLGLIAGGVILVALLTRPATVQIGTAAPGFSTEALGSSENVALRGYIGRPVILTFWTADCVNCKPLLRELNKLQLQDSTSSGVKVLAVNLDKNGDRARAAAKELGISLLVLHDPSGKIKRGYHVYGVPATFLIDSSLTIRDRMIGVPYSNRKALIPSAWSTMLRKTGPATKS
jgi:cytochrome c biogenesis protein CcmG, thiol:disulfide interchange protein DsbE